MAYLKYKELTKYYYFYKSMDVGTLPKYVTDYVEKGETLIAAYATRNDKGIFTDNRIILFDNRTFPAFKQIYMIPYKAISTLSITFYFDSASILIYVDSGYPVTLKFKNLKADNKTDLRLMYSEISKNVMNR